MTRPDRASEADQLPEWHVEVDGCVNFRDAGGWETIEGAMVRRGRLYRSDDPTRITSSGCAAVDRLGLAKVIDLGQQTQFSRTPGWVECSTSWRTRRSPASWSRRSLSLRQRAFSPSPRMNWLVVSRPR